MKSMTGFGRGEGVRQGIKVTVEISSVNRRQAEIVLTLPREIEALEARIRDEVNRHVARGRLAVRLAVQLSEGQWASRVRLNLPLAKAYARELERLGRELRIEGSPTYDSLLRLPGVVQNDDTVSDTEACWPAVEAALAQALDALVRTRKREGLHLAKELRSRIAVMRKAVREVRRLAPEVTRRYQRQLIERIQQAGLPAPSTDDERLLKEVVLFADRSDISEELSRLESHFQQFDDCLASTEPVGRMLDFLAQEMNREVNTLGSKANEAAISRLVVTLKTELEKFREQAQNVE